MRAGPKAAPTSPSTSRGRGDRASGCARRPGTGTPRSWCTAPGPVPPHVPWLEPDVNDHLEELADGACPRSSWSRSGSSPTTWRSSTTSTPRRGRPPRRSGSSSCARRRPGWTRGSSPWCATCCSSARPSSAASEVSRAAVGRPARLVGLCPAGCCANPRGPRPALCGRGLTAWPWTPTELLELARSVAVEAAELVRDPAPRGRRGGRHQVQRGRRRDRGGPRLRSG